MFHACTVQHAPISLLLSVSYLALGSKTYLKLKTAGLCQVLQYLVTWFTDSELEMSKPLLIRLLRSEL
jgi:hypothetical protein